MQKIIFIDRDGTLINEPDDFQIDCFSKFSLVQDVFTALKNLSNHGFKFVMITNQDGLGSKSYPKQDFDKIQKFLLELFSSQGINFLDVLVCPHYQKDNCDCRKPKINLLIKYLKDSSVDWQNCYVIGDRYSDLALADNLKIKGFLIKSPFNQSNKKYDHVKALSWLDIAQSIITHPRVAEIHRVTKETDIKVFVNLDKQKPPEISSRLSFFDHMLEQIGYHGKFYLSIQAQADLEVDDHHLIEDCAIALGNCIKKALTDKAKINRYGFCLPMDEARCEVLIDLCSRSYFVFEGSFLQGYVGKDRIDVNMFKHFFKSISAALQCNLHIKVSGENTHHMIEAMFKCFAKALHMSISTSNDKLDNLMSGFFVPSSKEVL